MAASGLQEQSLQMALMDWAHILYKTLVTSSNNASALGGSVCSLVDFTFEPMLNDGRLFKVGRAMGFTRGVYSPLRTSRITTRVIDGEETTQLTREHTIVSGHGQHIVEKGDAGSLVYNKASSVVGLLFGGSLRWTLDTSPTPRFWWRASKNALACKRFGLRK
ncbi:uncharacterized protein ATNIH1004_007200 [Aspergillus tanneri]|uniref:Uncharacterized protein n=1 Tax=Aspergillus tanneri TaxID=1220188 RepID=A0A5M9MKB4_9EURO|nr:uncharacterized protein ATNIH1004_007200 [Aspergillus tanneri]KAA8645780.1 hypothetical protein ATNIH1004_007200 [Aspergillus tanneri]